MLCLFVHLFVCWVFVFCFCFFFYFFSRSCLEDVLWDEELPVLCTPIVEHGHDAPPETATTGKRRGEERVEAVSLVARSLNLDEPSSSTMRDGPPLSQDAWNDAVTAAKRESSLYEPSRLKLKNSQSNKAGTYGEISPVLIGQILRLVRAGPLGKKQANIWFVFCVVECRNQIFLSTLALELAKFFFRQVTRRCAARLESKYVLI